MDWMYRQPLGERVYLHGNTYKNQSVKANLRVEGQSIRSGRIVEMAAEPEFETMRFEDMVVLREASRGDALDFPAASVSAVELELAV